MKQLLTLQLFGALETKVDCDLYLKMIMQKCEDERILRTINVYRHLTLHLYMINMIDILSELKV